MGLIPRDPDGWARRWAQVAGACSILGFIGPSSRWTGDHTSEWGWDLLQRGEEELWALAVDLSPLVVGIAVLALATWTRGRLRAVALLACGAAAFFLRKVLADVMYAVEWDQFAEDYRQTKPEYYAVFLGCIAVAAGAHLRWRFPDGKIGRWMAGSGALVLLVIVGRIAGVEWTGAATGFRDGVSGTAWPNLLVLGTYGTVGLLSLRLSAATTRTARWMSRVALFAYPIAMFAESQATDYWSGEPNAWILTGVSSLTAGFQAAGTALLIPLGVAALVESVRFRRANTLTKAAGRRGTAVARGRP